MDRGAISCSCSCYCVRGARVRCAGCPGQYCIPSGALAPYRFPIQAGNFSRSGMNNIVDGRELAAASRRDLLLVGAATLLFFTASVAFELSEKVLAWTRPWERYQLDEIPGTLMFLALGLA